MAEMVAGDSRYRYSVAWIDAGTRSAAGRGVLSRGDHASADDIAAKQRDLNFEPRQRIDVPALVPNGLLNGTTINAFNEVWFRKAPRHRRDELVSLGTFFHPLDGVSNWNRMYGRSGFVQYQFVVPDTASHLIDYSLEALRAIGATSFLSVLKRFGPASTGLLSFPQPGWTLALDIPAAVSGLAGVLTSLDEQVAAVGGRIYLAKDSRMSPAMFATMYPNHTKFREIRERIDPNHHMNSDLARRLQL
jgi:decaprenylphospho-beta-D-ribofuranose 2-oxidase